LKKIAYLLLPLILLAVTGCKLFVREPQVAVQSLNVLSVDPAGVLMELDLKVKNPNSFDLKLQGYNFDLKVMELPLAKGAAHEELKFPSGGEADLRIPIRVTFADLMAVFKRQVDPEHVPYQLAAGFEVDTPLGRMTVPVSRTGTYAIPKQYRPGSVLNKMMDFLRMNH